MKSASTPTISLTPKVELEEPQLRREPSCLRIDPPPAKVKRHKQDPSRIIQIDEYKLRMHAGEGSMGKVYLAVHNKTGERVAIKIVARTLQVDAYGKPKSDREIRKILFKEDRIVKEANLLRIMRHPHIVQVHHFASEPSAFYIFMEYMEGNQLLDHIARKRRLDEREARRFARQIVSALDYLHRNSIVHRDLKIENIMLDKSKRNIKLVDFGLASMFRPEGKLETYCGSLYFAAPELLKAEPYCGPEVDVWSFGCVIYCMVSGSIPFDDPNLPRLHDKIRQGLCAYPAFITASCVNLLQRIFQTNPSKRITLADVMRHEWLNRGYKYCVKSYVPIRLPIVGEIPPRMLTYMSSNLRLGSEDAIAGKWKYVMGSRTHKSLTCKLALIRYYEPRMKTVEELRRQPYDDPQNLSPAYHPIVSAYHLYSERSLGLEVQQIEDIPEDLSPDLHLYGHVPGYQHERRFKVTPYPRTEYYSRIQNIPRCYSDTDSSSCGTTSPPSPSTPSPPLSASDSESTTTTPVSAKTNFSSPPPVSPTPASVKSPTRMLRNILGLKLK